MGNCLAIEGKVIKIIKKDGEVLQYSSPLQVQHVLSDLEAHVIVESPAASHHLQPVSSPEPETQHGTNFTSIAGKEATGCDERFKASGSGGLIRIKVVVTKQQLAEMLNKAVSVEDMILGQWKGTSDFDGSAGSNSRGLGAFTEKHTRSI